MNIRRLGAELAACMAIFAPLGALADPGAPDGTVLVAKSGKQSLIVWDATPVVASIVTNKTPREEALRTLESQAIDIADSKAAGLTGAQTITVRIIYEKSGDVSPTYKIATFTGCEFDTPIARLATGRRHEEPPVSLALKLVPGIPGVRGPATPRRRRVSLA